MEFRKRVNKSYPKLFRETDEDNDQESIQNEFSEEGQFAKQWGWYTSIYQLAQGDIRRFDEVTDIELFAALTFLTFEKQKNEIEIRKIKKQQTQS